MKNLSEKAQTLGNPATIVARFNSLTNRNHHTEATQHLNKIYLKMFPKSAVHAAYKTLLADIAAGHELAGYMPDHLGKLRNAIQGALIDDLRIHGIDVMGA